MTDTLYDYIQTVGVREHDVLRRLRLETATMPMSIMQISPEQGAFFSLLVRLIGAKNTLEIGTFTGYSALAVALALPEEGRLIACDVSEEWTSVARRYWQEAGVADRVELRLAPAEETLTALLEADRAGSFDFAFIDADKSKYDTYYELSLRLMRQGGLVAIDNVFRDGAVVDPNPENADTRAVRRLNEKIRHDERVDLCMLPVGDGLTLVRKR